MCAEKDEARRDGPAIYPGKAVSAKFLPKRTDDLKADAIPLIGRVGLFEALWVIDDEGP